MTKTVKNYRYLPADPSVPHPSLRRVVPFLLVAPWLLATGFGLRWLEGYDNSPGPAGPTLTQRSEAAASQSGVPTLVLALHPHCSCSRASLDELSEVLMRYPCRLHVRVLFVKPAGFNEDWVRTDLWNIAAALPGVEVVCDECGREAQRWGARTSGQTLLFDASGNLMFSGGITAARGHVGENVGVTTVLSMLKGSGPSAPARTGPVCTPVFGCSLF